MEEEDHDELLQCTDDESISESDDHCLPIDKAEENYRHTLIYFNHSKLEFVTTKLFLILSSTFLVILLPLYMETVNVESDVYAMIFTNTVLSTVLFIIIMISAKMLFTKYKDIKVLSFPIKLARLVQLSLLYIVGGIMVVYAVDRKRVLCHLQDPIKGVVLVFSLLYYFFFCRKLMGLQRIFYTTTIIVGLFIAVDYGLCDEFRCRGYEREHILDDAGQWSWQTHCIWTTVYIVGLGLFAAYFTLLDSYLLFNNEMECHTINIPSLLSTVSRSVPFPSTRSTTSSIISDKNVNSPALSKKHSVVHISMWMHIFGLLVIIALFFTDIIPSVGNADSLTEFFNHTINGVKCHFTLPVYHSTGIPPCGNMFLYSWIFLCAYALFTVMSIKFLILSQSAVYTIATMAASLPFVGIWWSLFHMVPLKEGLLIWSPSATGELICSLLGLPIVVIGLCLLCKSHFNDYQWSRLGSTQIMSSNHLA